MTSPGSTIRVVAAVLEKGGRYLITQRRAEAVLPLLWEFPGGRVEEGEGDLEALAREVKHRVGVDIEGAKLISYVCHRYERYSVELYLYECSISRGDPSAVNVRDLRWVRSSEFEDYPFTPADELSMMKLLGIAET